MLLGDAAMVLLGLVPVVTAWRRASRRAMVIVSVVVGVVWAAALLLLWPPVVASTRSPGTPWYLLGVSEAVVWLRLADYAVPLSIALGWLVFAVRGRSPSERVTSGT